MVEARIHPAGDYGQPFAGTFNIHVAGKIASITALCANGECKGWDHEVESYTRKYLQGLGVERVFYEYGGEQIERDIRALETI